MKSILVLGAGELGLPILVHLAQHPVTLSGEARISVLLRPQTLSFPPKSSLISHLRFLRITLVPGDIATSTEDDLASIFKPYDVVLSATGFAAATSQDSRIQLKIAKCVIAAGVKRYYPWQFGVDYGVIGRGNTQPLFDEQLDVRDLLRKNERSTEWVIISTGVFTSFLFERFWGVLDLDAECGEAEGEGRGNKEVVRAFGKWENKVTATAPEDIARCTAEIVLGEHGERRNEVVYLAGDTVTYERLAEVVEGVLGRKLGREVWSLERLREEARRDMTGDQVKRYRPVWAEGKGVAWSVEESWNGRRGWEMVGMEESARRVLEGKK